MRPGIFLALAGALCIVNPAHAASGAYAVVVGIDDYKALPKLQGAVNDAKSLDAALKAGGANEVVTLLNEQATRVNFEEAVRRMGAKAAANNGWLVITYAGHGGQEPERIEGDERDGLDEVLLFPEFQTAGGGNAERLPDNEMRTLLESIPSNVQIVLLVDACHSGTMTRAPDPRSVGITYRNAQYGSIVDDQLPPPLPVSKGKEVAELRNVLFVASALDSEKTPEIEINGAKHGAVSWHMAEALRGRADADADGKTTLGELRQFLVVAPRAIAQGRQTPGVFFFPGRETEIFSLAPSVSNLPTIPKNPVNLWSLQDPAESVTGLNIAQTAANADLLWDQNRGQVIDNRSEDLIAVLPAGGDPNRFLAGVVGKQRALRELYLLVANDPLALDIGPRGAGSRYAAEKVSIQVPPRPSEDLLYLTIFNLAGDGTVQMLFPATSAEAMAQASGETKAFSNNVKPPYGADHVIAIATATDPTELRSLLKGLDGQQAAEQATDAIAKLQQDQRTAVGVVGLFTGQD